jgi:hypothetical protein
MGGDTLRGQVDFLLSAAGAHSAKPPEAAQWPHYGRIYESKYSIVSVWEFKSAQELVENWATAQDLTSEVMASRLDANEAKSWDGYLILCSPGTSDDEAVRAMDGIREDTRHLRKILVVATISGPAHDHSRSLANIRRSLAPLLPLELSDSVEAGDPLETIESRVDDTDTVREDLRNTLASYQRGLPAMGELLASVRQALEND